MSMSLHQPGFPPREPHGSSCAPARLRAERPGRSAKAHGTTSGGHCTKTTRTVFPNCASTCLNRKQTAMEKAPILRSVLKSEVRPSSGMCRENSDSRTVKNLDQKDKPWLYRRARPITQLGLIPDCPPWDPAAVSLGMQLPHTRKSVLETQEMSPFRVHVTDREHGLSRLLSPAHRSCRCTLLAAGGSDVSPGLGRPCSAPTRSGTRTSPGPPRTPLFLGA